MNVGAVGAIGGGTPSVYELLSPYLNGVIRTSNAAAAAQLQAAAAATSAAATQAAIAARAAATASTTAAPPFANPAITAIGERIALGESLVPPSAVTPDALLGAPSFQQPSPADQVLHGDSGTLIQSYGAVALATGVLTPPPVFAQPVTPVIPPASLVTRVPRPSAVS
jgi:hypothetical protein